MKYLTHCLIILFCSFGLANGQNQLSGEKYASLLNNVATNEGSLSRIYLSKSQDVVPFEMRYIDTTWSNAKILTSFSEDTFYVQARYNFYNHLLEVSLNRKRMYLDNQFVKSIELYGRQWRPVYVEELGGYDLVEIWWEGPEENLIKQYRIVEQPTPLNPELAKNHKSFRRVGEYLAVEKFEITPQDRAINVKKYLKEKLYLSNREFKSIFSEVNFNSDLKEDFLKFQTEVSKLQE